MQLMVDVPIKKTFKVIKRTSFCDTYNIYNEEKQFLAAVGISSKKTAFKLARYFNKFGKI